MFFEEQLNKIHKYFSSIYSYIDGVHVVCSGVLFHFAAVVVEEVVKRGCERVLPERSFL